MHDKLYLPGLQKLKRLIDSGFFGRILSVRGEFGYWVFEGDWQPAQRPSWNYRAEDGGGIIVDMFPHWNYVLENLFGRVESVYARAVTDIPERVDEEGHPYPATADDAAYAIFELEGGVIAQLNSSWTIRVNRDELVEFQVDGTHGSAVVGLFGCKIQPRNATPKPVWNPDLADAHDYDGDWIEVPTNDVFENGFKTQWEEFIRHVVEDAPQPLRLPRRRPRRAAGRGGARSSSTEGRRIDLPDLTLEGGRRMPRAPRCCNARVAAGRRADRGALTMTAIALIDGTGPARRALAEAPAFSKPRHPLRAGWPTRPRTWCPSRRREHPRRSRPTSTGTPPWPSVTTSGRGGSASPTPWTPRSATWASTPRPPAS